MITMTEIAKLTGVSQPTVSRVLNGNKAVNPAIRERVLTCAKEHDFQPNMLAQSLVGSKTRLIGVVLTDISNAFFADLVKYIEQEARKENYSLILFNSNYDKEHEKECFDVVRRYRVDGLIAVPVDEHSVQWKETVRKLDIPTVVITRRAQGMDSFYVAHDEAGAQVGRHLCEAGYEEYIFFGNTEDIKYKGFVSVIEAQGRSRGEHLTVIRSKDAKQVQTALEEHFYSKSGRTGIFAYNDRRALEMLGILQKMGIKVPERAGIVGFDNTYICDYVYPHLSSVSQPNEEMASLAVKRLLHKISHPEDGSVVDYALRASIVPRESSVF